MKKHLIYIAAAVVLLLGGCGSGAGQERTKTETARTEASEAAAESFTETAAEEETSEQADEQKASKDIFAMDTYMTVTAYGDAAEEAVDAAVSEIERLDALLSTGIESSEVAQINAKGGGVLSEDTAALMSRSLELYEDTDGIFDIAIYPVMKLWGFTDEQYQVPDDASLSEALSLADPSLINYDPESQEVTFDEPGVMLDFGAIAKGYTSSRVVDIYKSCGVSSGLINLGGNVQLLGDKPDGSSWRVGIQHPEDQTLMLGVLAAEDKAVITSGGYERYFEQDGVRYHHIIDPADGYPADNGLISVTIVSDDGMLADALSTTLFIMGPDEAMAYWRAHSDLFDAVLVTDEGEIFVTEGIRDAFTSDYPFEIIETGD